MHLDDRQYLERLKRKTCIRLIKRYLIQYIAKTVICTCDSLYRKSDFTSNELCMQDRLNLFFYDAVEHVRKLTAYLSVNLHFDFITILGNSLFAFATG